MVADTNGNTTADVMNLINVNGTLYFAAYTTQNGFPVWQSDGTSGGTVGTPASTPDRRAPRRIS